MVEKPISSYNLSRQIWGTYSGGAFTAWPLLPDQVPDQAWGSDVDCVYLYRGKEYLVGLGDTPSLALQDLLNKMANKTRISRKELEDLQNNEIKEKLDNLRFSEI